MIGVCKKCECEEENVEDLEYCFCCEGRICINCWEETGHCGCQDEAD